MLPKAHGTSEVPVQESLRYGVSNKLADRITNYNRRFAELGVSLYNTPSFCFVLFSLFISKQKSGYIRRRSSSIIHVY